MLVVADQDTRRFTIEGPMSNAEPWIAEVLAARRAGRQIICRVLSGSADEAADFWRRTQGGARWPSGFIVCPAMPGEDQKLPSACAHPTSLSRDTVVPATMVAEALRVLYRSNRLKCEAPGEDERLVTEMLRSALALAPASAASSS